MSRLLCALLLTTSPALAEAPSVVTDLPLTQSLVAGILGEGAEVMEADLVISFKVFREKFGSRVVLIPGERRIETEYLDGPFKYLHSFWEVEPEGDGCRVRFEVDFEFRNAILQKVIGLVFDEAMRRVVGAFETRARKLYG